MRLGVPVIICQKATGTSWMMFHLEPNRTTTCLSSTRPHLLWNGMAFNKGVVRPVVGPDKGWVYLKGMNGAQLTTKKE